MTDKTIETTAQEEVVTPTEEKKKTRSDEELEEIVKQRLRQQSKAHEKKEHEYQAQLDDKQAKIDAYEKALQAQSVSQPGGQATTITSTPTTTSEQSASKPIVQPHTQSNTPDNNIPAELLPYILDQQKKQINFQKKIDEAASKDEEFAKLLKKSDYPIPAEIVQRMYHLDNAAAVAKQLLKNPKDNEEMLAAAQEGNYELIKFLNKLSDKLEANVSKPAPSKFTPAEDLSDVGDSGQDWDLAEYIKGKR